MEPAVEGRVAERGGVLRQFVWEGEAGEINTTVTVGRQDIILGDGWLVLEGTPLDGSTSIYFDAIRSTTELKEMQTTVDVIYINQYSDPDAWLPTMGVVGDPQIEQNERGAILWVANKFDQGFGGGRVFHLQA